jgi:UDP-glucose 4-epimerase
MSIYLSISSVEFWQYNIAMNENILKLSHAHQVQKLVSCLSTCIFPDKTTFPIDETMIQSVHNTASNGTVNKRVMQCAHVICC